MRSIRNLIKRIQEFFKNFTFRKAMYVFFGLLSILIVLNIFFVSKTPVEPILTINDNQTITDQNGKVISYYTYADNAKSSGNGNFLTIYVDDIKTISGDEMKLLKNRILAKRGFRESETAINFKQATSIENLSANSDYFPDEGETFDPSDPSTFLGKTKEELGIKYTTEPIENTTFAEFYSLNPGTTYFDIIKNSENNYTIILKNAYKESDFRANILNSLMDGSSVNIEFTDIYKFKESAN